MRWVQTLIILVVVLGTIIVINVFKDDFFDQVGEFIQDKADSAIGFTGDLLGPVGMSLGNTGRVKRVNAVVIDKDILLGDLLDFDAGLDVLDVKRYIVIVIYREVEYSIESERVYSSYEIGDLVVLDQIKSGNLTVLRAPTG